MEKSMLNQVNIENRENLRKDKSMYFPSDQSNSSTQYKYIIGEDEAGRGPLAGPVVAAACFLPADVIIDGIIDSKTTKESDREISYNDIVNNKDILWGVSIVSHLEIDELNILQASLKAMRQAVNDLLGQSTRKGVDINSLFIY